jgi:hypothetical protein
VQHLDRDVADGDGVAAVVLHEVGVGHARHPLHERRLVPVHVDRHVELGDALERFGDYGKRFDLALGKVKNGERDWFAKPMIDSYHTIWFELHEDLLATLGIERSKEGTS